MIIIKIPTMVKTITRTNNEATTAATMVVVELSLLLVPIRYSHKYNVYYGKTLSPTFLT